MNKHKEFIKECYEGDEVWNHVVGYEGIYQVSDKGKIKSLTRKVLKNKGEKPYLILERILKTSIDKQGYLCIGLCKDGKHKTMKVHRIVAMSFIPNPENKPEINHINTIKNDNRIENLEWCTRAENVAHSIKNKLPVYKNGEENANSKLKKEDVAKIKNLLETTNKTLVEIAKDFPVTFRTISLIKNKKSWVN